MLHYPCYAESPRTVTDEHKEQGHFHNDPKIVGEKLLRILRGGCVTNTGTTIVVPTNPATGYSSLMRLNKLQVQSVNPNQEFLYETTTVKDVVSPRTQLSKYHEVPSKCHSPSSSLNKSCHYDTTKGTNGTDSVKLNVLNSESASMDVNAVPVDPESGYCLLSDSRPKPPADLDAVYDKLDFNMSLNEV